MPTIVQLPSGRFRAFARVKDQRDSQIFDRKAEAERWATATETRMRNGQWRPRPRQADGAPLTVADAFKAYVESDAWQAKSELTRRAEVSKQRAVIRALGTVPLAKLTPELIRAYISERSRASPATHRKTNSVNPSPYTGPGLPQTAPTARLSTDQVRLEIAALSSMCNFAVENGWISTNPVRGIKRPRSTRRVGRIDDQTFARILSSSVIRGDPKASLFFRLLFATACRPGELARAKIENYYPDAHHIHLPRTKNEDERIILIPDNLVAEFNYYLDLRETDAPYIFPTPGKDGTWKPLNYHHYWKKIRQETGIPNEIVPHLARHEVISRLFEKTTLSDGQIAAISGHRSAQSLWRYKHLRAEHSRGYINTISLGIREFWDAKMEDRPEPSSIPPGHFMDKSFPSTEFPKIDMEKLEQRQMEYWENYPKPLLYVGESGTYQPNRAAREEEEIRKKTLNKKDGE